MGCPLRWRGLVARAILPDTDWHGLVARASDVETRFIASSPSPARRNDEAIADTRHRLLRSSLVTMGFGLYRTQVSSSGSHLNHTGHGWNHTGHGWKAKIHTEKPDVYSYTELRLKRYKSA
jgi:hypothetical protein